MEELDLKEIINYYLKKLPIIFLFAALTTLIGYGYIEYYQIPMYHGKTTIILIQNNDQVTDLNSKFNETENQLDVNEKLVATYSEIIKSRRVLEQVINNLKLKTSFKSLKKKIEIESIDNTSIIEITVSNKDSKQATIIANELANVFKIEISNLYKLENVSIIDEAIPEDTPYNVNKPKQLIIYMLIGIMLSCILIFIIYYFDNTIKNKKEIKTKLNIPVLGEVPIVTELKSKEKTKPTKNKTKKSKNIKVLFQKKQKEPIIMEPIEAPKEETVTKKQIQTKEITKTKKDNPKEKQPQKKQTTKTTKTTKKNIESTKKEKKEGKK